MKNKNKLGLIMGFFFGFIFIITCTSVLNSETKGDSSAAGFTVVTYEKKRPFLDGKTTIDVPGEPVSIKVWMKHETYNYWSEAGNRDIEHDKAQTQYNPSNGTLTLKFTEPTTGLTQWSIKYVILCKES